MAFTPLQQLALKQAQEHVKGMRDDLNQVARLHNFTDNLYKTGTPETAPLEKTFKLEQLLNALLAEP